MHTRSEPDNPYAFDRYAFAWQHVPTGSAAHLDFGCADGRFLRSLRDKRVKCLVGIDISRQAIAQARQGSGGLEILRIERTVPLPFPDGTFTSITVLDVLEHIDEQEELLDELHRVLADDGVLIVTVPRRHAFSWLDLGNLKFRFPRLHRWYYCRRHCRQEYEQRYVRNPDGLIGDVSAAKRWHEHFSAEHLSRLLYLSGYDITDFDGSGLFVRVFKSIDLLVGRIAPFHAVIGALTAWDARTFASANLFCVARKGASLSVKHRKDSRYDYDPAGHDLQAAGPQHVL